jgi:dCMP deaminase
VKKAEQEFLLDIAKLAAERSTAVRLKVGAVVADSFGNLIASGYNGSIIGGDNNLEYKVYAPARGPQQPSAEYNFTDTKGPYKLVTKDSTIHAEQNLIAHAARRGISINNGTIFVTHSPCEKCTTLMIQCGIVEVVYIDEHRSFKQVSEEYGNRITLTKWNPDET